MNIIICVSFRLSNYKYILIFIDLGCGTGLCGRVFHNFVDSEVHNLVTATETNAEAKCKESSFPSLNNIGLSNKLEDLVFLSNSKNIKLPLFVGIDISSRILEIAARNGGYNIVICCDLHDALKCFHAPIPINTSSFKEEMNDNSNNENYSNNINNNINHCTEALIGLNLLIAADTFIYVGGLSSVFLSAQKAIVSKGLFIFSVENLDDCDVPHIQEKQQELQCSDSKQSKVITFSDLNDVQSHSDTTATTTTTSKINYIHKINENKNEIIFLNEGEEPVGAVPGWGAKLRSSARFAHSDTYIQALSIHYGFSVLACRKLPLRNEGSIAIMGIFYVLQRNPK